MQDYTENEYLELLKDEEIVLKVSEEFDKYPNTPLDIHVQIGEDEFGQRTVVVSSTPLMTHN
jgi:hypothetical protein